MAQYDEDLKRSLFFQRRNFKKYIHYKISCNAIGTKGEYMVMKKVTNIINENYT